MTIGEAMRDEEVPNKTEAGRDEIQQRSRRLPNTLRSILLLVDGQRTVVQLRDVIAGLRAPDDALQQLVVMGLIGAAEPTDISVSAAPPSEADERYDELYALMSEAVRKQLGLRGYLLQLKVARCDNTDELLALLPEITAALGKVRNFGFASEFDQRLRALAQV